MEKIFVSIASYRDQELIDTIFSILRQAKNPERIFISIFSQDEIHPNLENIFYLFNVKDFSYQKINYQQARGVGYARAQTQKLLNLSYTYYLQVDSHTQFIEHWDEKIINDYEKATEFWGNLIFTAYPGSYDITETGNIKVSDSLVPTCLRIQPASAGSVMIFEPKYKTYVGGEIGEYHGYFCAGLAFGYSKYFIEVPYDENVYFNGEEQTLSIRFYCKDIKLVAPPYNYCYHHYTGKRRLRHWEIGDESWKKYDEAGIQRLKDFFDYKLDATYGISNKEKYHMWQSCFVTPRTE
jgi:hypothetical protein